LALPLACRAWLNGTDAWVKTITFSSLLLLL
jgi:hypothetical protein